MSARNNDGCFVVDGKVDENGYHVASFGLHDSSNLFYIIMMQCSVDLLWIFHQNGYLFYITLMSSILKSPNQSQSSLMVSWRYLQQLQRAIDLEISPSLQFHLKWRSHSLV